MDIGQVLDAIREDRKITKNALARKTGLSVTGLNNIFQDKKSPTMDTFFKICDALMVAPVSVFEPETDRIDSDVLYLLKKANEQAKKTAIYALKVGQTKDHPDECTASNYFPRNEQPITIPVVGRAAAGAPIEMIQEYEDTIDIADPVTPGDFAVIATGDSMTGDDIQDGDRVVIHPQDTVEDGELALVAVDGGSTIKRVRRNGNGKAIELVPSNPAYKSQFYDFMHEVRILGKVIHVKKNPKN